MASGANNPTVHPRQAKFFGPARQEFASFQELALFSVDNYFPNWRNYDDPKSYIIPPVFEYRHPDVSDKALELALEWFRQQRTTGNPEKQDHVITERKADEAEHMVYKAIQQLIEDGYQAPFIAVHGLNIEKFQKYWSQFFPHLPWDQLRDTFKPCFREYDFFLIGPKIGIIVFEVKSTTRKDYMDAFKQLQTVDTLLRFLGECTGVKTLDETLAQKIVFTPNIEKTVQAKASKDSKTHKRAKTDKVEQWFKEDLTNFYGEADRPPLYNKFRKMLSKSTGISKDLFEAYAPIISAIASVTVFKSKAEFGLDKLKIMESETISKINLRIQSHNPLVDQQSSQLSSHSVLIKTPRAKGKPTSEDFSKVMFFTPDQQKILKGPPRQIISGAAGTGKTIVLQAKALQLLKAGKSVLIVAKENYGDQYKNLFDSYGFQNFGVRLFDDQLAAFLSKIKKWFEKYEEEFEDACLDCFKYLRGRVKWDKHKKLRKLTEWLLIYDHIFFDDAFDSPPRFEGLPIGAYTIILALASLVDAEKTVWIASDNYRYFPNLNRITYIRDDDSSAPMTADDAKKFLRNFFTPEDLQKLLNNFLDGVFLQASLNQVMRCTENIFRVAYNPDYWDPEMMPLLGHKIQGPRVTIVKEIHASSFFDAWTSLLKKISSEIQSLVDRDICLSDIAVIFYQSGDSTEKEWIIDYLLEGVIINNGTRVLSWISEKRENACVLCDCSEVSSLEWPIVIFVSCKINCYPSKYFSDAVCTELQYRAMTRATSKLIVISAIYDEETTEDDEEAAADEDEIVVSDSAKQNRNATTSFERKRQKAIANQDLFFKQKAEFVGPARHNFRSLQEQAVFFMENYLPNWRAYDHPKSYFIPFPCNYKRSEVSDSINEAEHQIYRAIHYLVQDGFQAPFLAVYKLDVKKFQHHLIHLFPDLPLEKLKEAIKPSFREYDFILIGPKTGIVVIEIIKENDFCKALEEINSANALFCLIEGCSGVKLPGEKTKKIVVLPKMKEPVSMDMDQMALLTSSIHFGNILIHWPDYSGKKTDKPPIYNPLRKALENNTAAMSKELYECYGQILASLASIIIFKTNKPHDHFFLDKLKIYENEAIKQLHLCIKSQGPMEKQEAAQKRKHPLLKNMPRMKTPSSENGDFSKVVFLTPDQQAALDGPCRQFIIGPAGTGKRIVLQAKALQLLSKGHSVLVIAPKYGLTIYKKQFDLHGFKNYELHCWTEKLEDLRSKLSTAWHTRCEEHSGINFIPFVYECALPYNDVAELAAIRDMLLACDHIIIEAAPIEHYVKFALMFYLVIMAIGSLGYSDKVIWISLSLFYSEFKPNKVDRNLFDIMLEEFVQNPKDGPGKGEEYCYYYVAILNQVMRCSRNVFQSCYDLFCWHPLLKPVLGHEIQGQEVTVVNELGTCNVDDDSDDDSENDSDSDDSDSEAWSKLAASVVSAQLQQLYDSNISLNDIAVVLSLHTTYVPRRNFDLFFDYLQSSVKVSKIRNALTPASKYREYQNASSLFKVLEVASVERPVVIYCIENIIGGLLPEDSTSLIKNGLDYVAISRAAAKLIIIIVPSSSNRMNRNQISRVTLQNADRALQLCYAKSAMHAMLALNSFRHICRQINYLPSLFLPLFSLLVLYSDYKAKKQLLNIGNLRQILEGSPLLQQNPKEFIEKLLSRLRMEDFFRLNRKYRCSSRECLHHWKNDSEKIISFDIYPGTKDSFQKQLLEWKTDTQAHCPQCHMPTVEFSLDPAHNPDQILIRIARYNDDGTQFDNRPIFGFHDEQVQISSSKYEVLSAIQHFGPNLRSGHYVAWVRSMYGWLKFDDLDKECPIFQTGFPKELAYIYLLFLNKCTGKLSGENNGAISTQPNNKPDQEEQKNIKEMKENTIKIPLHQNIAITRNIDLATFDNVDGVSCYANSAMHAMFAFSSFRQISVQQKHLQNLQSLTELFEQYEAKKQNLSTMYIRRDLGQPFLFGQQDAKEFIEKLLTQLNMEDFFQLPRRFRCMNDDCRHQWQNFTDLVTGLVVDPRKNKSFQEQLLEWKPESEAVCPMCKMPIVEFYIDVTHNPNQILVHIARHNDEGTDFDNRPILGFDDQLVKIDSNDYRLLSAIQHFGPSMYSGHYIAWVHSDEYGWLQFNDLNELHPISQNNFPLELENVYLLFLEKIIHHSS